MALYIMLAGVLGSTKEALERMRALTNEVFFLEEVERRKKAKDPQEILRKWMASGPVGLSAQGALF